MIFYLFLQKGGKPAQKKSSVETQPTPNQGDEMNSLIAETDDKLKTS